MQSCSRCGGALAAEEIKLCGGCELLYSCPECGTYYDRLADYNPHTHHACSQCLGTLYAAHPETRKNADILSAAIRESELRVSILGQLLPTWFGFLRGLHMLIYRTLRRQIMDDELDMLGAGN